MIIISHEYHIIGYHRICRSCIQYDKSHVFGKHYINSGNAAVNGIAVPVGPTLFLPVAQTSLVVD